MEYWEYEAGQTVLMSVMSFRLGRAKVCNKLQKPIAFDNKDWSFLFYAENPPKQNKRIELSPISLKYFHDEQNLSSTNLNTIILLVVIQFKFWLSSCYLVTYQNYDDASSQTLCYGLLLELHNLMEMYQISDSNSLMHDLFVRITAEFI